jgi:3-oxoacyl-[acyl-carrier-protein] synthase-3
VASPWTRLVRGSEIELSWRQAINSSQDRLGSFYVLIIFFHQKELLYFFAIPSSRVQQGPPPQFFLYKINLFTNKCCNRLSVGVGHYLPKRVVDNAEIEKLLKKPAGYVDKTKAGVKTRRWANPLTEQSSTMGAHAMKEAVQDAGLTLDDIDCIITAGGAPERTLPDLAHLLQHAVGLGRSGKPCFHIHATCLSFCQGILTSASLLNSGVYKTIALVCAETPTACLDVTHPEQCILFSDGAACVIVTLPTPTDSPSTGLHCYSSASFGEAADLTTVRGGGTEYPPACPRSIRQIDTKEPMRTSKPEHDVFHMDGPKVVEYALSLAEYYDRFWPGCLTSMAGMDIVIPHQASGLALQLFRSFNWDIVDIIEHHGNMMAASIPLALYIAVKDGRIKRGTKVGIAGTGAGFSGALFVLQF